MNAVVFEPPWVAAGGEAKTRALDTGLWVFIGVASSLFALFLTAYVMRMDGGDWSTIALPPQLWLSTALLLASSALLQGARAETQSSAWADGGTLLLPAAGVCGLAFLAVQAWGWQALLAANVTLTANPAASFFYLLTALHGMHVVGGLVAWVATMRSLHRPLDPAHAKWLVALCARYWHFLLAVWAVLFATLGWLSPEVVRFICGRG